LEDIGADGRTILKLIIYKDVISLWVGFIWLRIGSKDQLLVNTTTDLPFP
jgi:hypothetical protein